ncbi:uncharacterized protein MONBRDRAFT_26717 [Monosiga brevicollis MX1]|uniref:Uncharacterized protein n=1 Tax=Monosiga brevicollis TaxID=81824 RepID=A9V360_MONBE|nr:uncharacterized protein MONBRDRAFT_26717 [Monosiga brevicollis MX1]EDQ88132.1 predicted protein [Monosiga brevicollis MX1]|eukprot:XP_001747208.1 hypothetical protein [Monosiga brevicollis MX1]
MQRVWFRGRRTAISRNNARTYQMGMGRTEYHHCHCPRCSLSPYNKAAVKTKGYYSQRRDGQRDTIRQGLADYEDERLPTHRTQHLTDGRSTRQTNKHRGIERGVERSSERGRERERSTEMLGGQESSRERERERERSREIKRDQERTASSHVRVRTVKTQRIEYHHCQCPWCALTPFNKAAAKTKGRYRKRREGQRDAICQGLVDYEDEHNG